MLLQRLCLLLLFTLSSLATIAQNTLKMRAYQVAVFADNEWTDWMPSENLFVFNTDQLVQYGNQVPFIYRFTESVQEKESTVDRLLYAHALDEENDPCKIRIRYHKDMDYYQLYIDYGKVSLVFNVDPTQKDKEEESEFFPINRSAEMNDGEWTYWKKTNHEIRITDTQVKLFKQGDLTIYDIIYDVMEESNDSIRLIKANAIDPAGEKCEIKIQYFKPKDQIRIYMNYPDKSYGYEVGKPIQ